MIYLVRHGEAASGWGAHPDPGLSDMGQAQATSAAEALSAFSIQAALTSPMRRCQETAAPFAHQEPLELSIEPRVTEIPTPGDIVDRVLWLRSLMSGEWDATPKLVQDWRQTLIDTVSALPENTVVFSHFVAINAIVGHMEGSNKVTVFRPNHCSITQVKPTESGLKLIRRGEEAGTKVL